MQISDKRNTAAPTGTGWRHALLIFTAIGSLALMLSMQPFGQNPDYHEFADRRVFFGIQNFFDVISNITFFLVGIVGIRLCLVHRSVGFRSAWITFFAGVAIVSAGSAYYHLNPNNDSLVWDRLPMTIGFMGLFVALVTEYTRTGFGKYFLVLAILMGLSSVIYWHLFDDLRPYVWIQFMPLLTVPVLMMLFRPQYSHQWLLLIALACYMLAKLLEVYDRQVFVLTQNHISGHSLKHLLAALGCFFVLVMLETRRPIGNESAP